MQAQIAEFGGYIYIVYENITSKKQRQIKLHTILKQNNCDALAFNAEYKMDIVICMTVKMDILVNCKKQK